MVRSKGDFVMVTWDQEKFKGQIKDIVKDEYIIEICINKRKSEANELDVVRVKEKNIESLNFSF